MAKLMFARLCKEIKKNQKSGRYSLEGSFATLRWTKGAVGFVCVVYWESAEEMFQQSFVLRDEAGNVLDENPVTECVLTKGGENMSTAFFYTSFPDVGQYSIEAYQNGTCIGAIPLEVVDAWQSLKSPPAPLESIVGS